MKKIINPYTGLEGYRCFGCDPDNVHGLRMTFQEEGEEVVSNWWPDDRYQGYLKILHGGIQATLMDEIASWYIQVKMGTGGVTHSLGCKFEKPVYTGKGPITVRARKGSEDKRLVTILVDIYNPDNELCSSGKVTYYVYPEAVARKRLNYPGRQSFTDPRSP